jgi:hypothetical protein
MEFASSNSELPLSELSQLIADGSSTLSWSHKRELVHRAAALLRSNTERIYAAKILLLLAKDKKWEVRKAVADQLLQVPETLYEQLIPLLAKDPNTLCGRFCSTRDWATQHSECR